jgi:1-acyl-sn-glycerol-3-phosphate acyltransferase
MRAFTPMIATGAAGTSSSVSAAVPPARERMPALPGDLLGVRRGRADAGRAWARLAAMAAVTAGCAVRVAVCASLAQRAAPVAARHCRDWSRLLNALLGVRVTVRGAPPREPCLLVANHRSYIDITVLGAQQPSVFVAKSELAGWPLLGRAARAGATIFVQREDERSRRRTREAMADVLRAGVVVVNFAEGTTSRPPTLRPLRPGGFRLAAELGLPVVPVALHYDDPDDAWVEDDTFGRHFLAQFAKPELRVTASYGPRLVEPDAERLRRAAEAWLRQALASPGGPGGGRG